MILIFITLMKEYLLILIKLINFLFLFLINPLLNNINYCNNLIMVIIILLITNTFLK